MAAPNTPPDTPDPGKGTGLGTAINGNVGYGGAEFNNSIATGHIHGYEVILATINVTVDSANNLTKNIQEFMAKVDLQLDQVSSKVGAAASVLGSISALVVKQAEKKGLTVDKEVKVIKEIRNEETGRGIVGSLEETRQKLDARGEILSMTCFQAIKERAEGAQEAFDDITGKIKKAHEVIDRLQKLHQDGQEPATRVRVGGGPDAKSAQRHLGKGKVGLSDKDRKTVLLTEEDVVWMDKKVEIHWKDLFVRFIIFEYSLDHERREKEEEDMENIRKELESVKLVGKNMWKEIKRLAKYLCGDGEPSPLDDRGPRPRPPEALQRLPEPSRVNSLYAGWEFRKSLPPHPYGRLQPAQKPSWSAVPQRMPFSTEELFLRVLGQAAQRARSGRTLRDDYWGALIKAGQRALVDELVQTQSQHLQRDFPELEWTIAGLETRTDPWASVAAYGRSRAKKTRKIITAFEVILKTEWRITRGYGPPPIPGRIRGPTPVGPSGLGLGLGPLPRGAPPDGCRPQAPRGPVEPPFPSGGGAGGGQGVPIIISADAGIGGPQRMPQIPVHSQTRPRESTRFKHRPMMVLREPKWLLVKKKTKSKDKKKSRRKDVGEHKNRRTSKPRVYVELLEPGRYYRPAAAGPSGGGQPSSPGPGISHRLPSVQPLRPPRPASGFVPADGGRWRTHTPPIPPVACPPQPTHIHVSSAQTQREEEEEEADAEKVVEEIFEEFSELTDTKGGKGNRRRRSGRNMQVPEQVGSDPAAGVADERRRMEEDRRRQDARPDVSISRSLMKRVEWASSRKLTAESEKLHARSVKLERMAERQAPPLGRYSERQPPRPPMRHASPRRAYARDSADEYRQDLADEYRRDRVRHRDVRTGRDDAGDETYEDVDEFLWVRREGRPREARTRGSGVPGMRTTL